MFTDILLIKSETYMCVYVTVAFMTKYILYLHTWWCI